MRVIIGVDYDKKTIKDWLYANNVSRSLITRLKKLESGIAVNGVHATVRQVLHINDELMLALDDCDTDENLTLVASEMPLCIIYEDRDMIAVNKPAGIPTHPSHGHFTDTLANGLAYYYKSSGTPFVFRAVNRLDRNTSGVVLVAKNQYSASTLNALMQAGKIRKTYIAALNGIPEPLCGTITAPIRRRSGTVILREALGSDESSEFITGNKDAIAKSATTVYETLAKNRTASIIRAEPITGRTHQLRVHFAYIGTPLIGDGLYGSAESNPTEFDAEIKRHALHAASLVVEREEGVLSFDAKLPLDMQMLCNKIIGTEFSV